MEELYEKLKEQFNLPNFDRLDNDFEISDIEEDTFILRNVRKKIADKIENIVQLLNDIFHPDNSFASLKESNNFTDADREKIAVLYQKLMFYYRSATELAIEDSEEANAKFINDFDKEWDSLKGEALVYVKKLKSVWTGAISIKEDVGYLG